MIVLDEHLQGIGLEENIRRWYTGQVSVITALRPGTVIKDEAVPTLLRSASEPTFVTLNWSDFWQRTEPHEDFCLVSFNLPSSRASEISPLLRRLFRLPEFRSKAARRGKIARVDGERVSYYHARGPEIFQAPLPG
jgi:hypothetical protein